MFGNSAKIYFWTLALFDPVSSLILLRSLRVYILKQIFCSISVIVVLEIFTPTIHLDFKEQLFIVSGIVMVDISDHLPVVCVTNLPY